MFGAPGRIRTSDLLVRSQALYPAELRAHIAVLQLIQNTRCRRCDQISAGGGNGLRLGRNKGDTLDDVEAGATKKLMYNRFGEPRRVVLYANRFTSLVDG